MAATRRAQPRPSRGRAVWVPRILFCCCARFVHIHHRDKSLSFYSSCDRRVPHEHSSFAVRDVDSKYRVRHSRKEDRRTFWNPYSNPSRLKTARCIFYKTHLRRLLGNVPREPTKPCHELKAIAHAERERILSFVKAREHLFHPLVPENLSRPPFRVPEYIGIGKSTGENKAAKATESFWTSFAEVAQDRKSTRLNSSHISISYTLFS